MNTQEDTVVLKWHGVSGCWATDCGQYRIERGTYGWDVFWVGGETPKRVAYASQLRQAKKAAQDRACGTFSQFAV